MLQPIRESSLPVGTAPRTREHPGVAPLQWQTLAVAVVIYGGFALLTWAHDRLPWWLLAAVGGYLVAWQGSLQHEVVHGHPTRWPLLNRLLVLPNLGLWLPFEIYRAQHLRHHCDEQLTSPAQDPESFYLPADAWAAAPRLLRALLWAHNTLLGRLVLGPPIAVVRLLCGLLSGRDPVYRWPRAWAWHAAGVALVLGWVVGVCGLDLGSYLLLLAYPGLSLTLLRSYLEHQARPHPAERTAIVEAGPLFALLFLNNNLHVVHHARPGLPWYRIPGTYRAEREAILAGNGGYRYRGYWEVAARHLLWPKEAPFSGG